MQQRVLVPGEVVWIRRRRWLVERSRRYGEVTHVDVLSDRGRATFLSPFDRVTTPPRRLRWREVSAANAVRRLASLLSSTTSARAPASAVDADVRLWPFQLEPVLAWLHGVRRILIADEVGLGKTIQAGLVVAEACRRRSGARVIVVVPASLAPPWADELARRFAIPAMLADARELERLACESGRGANVWQRRVVWIASIDFLKQAHIRAALPHDPWDLVVFDEAHALCGDSQRYEAATAIASRARALLLLTATPHDGDARRFDRLLALGAIPHDQQNLVAFRRTRVSLGLPRTRRIRWLAIPPTGQEREVLDTLALYEQAAIRATRLASVSEVPDAVMLLLSVFRKRALSSMHALDVSLRRRLAWIDRASSGVQPDWEQIDLFEVDSDELSRDDARILTANIGLDPTHERLWLCRLIRLAGAATGEESKLTALRTLLRRTTEPVVVFTEFRHTLEMLQQELHAVRTMTILHGGQPAAEQQESLRTFLDGGATLLLATDVASQGLNLQQRARWVIGFDVPWNPARLEQRVGRVDRLGQMLTVHATILVRRHSAEAALLARVEQRTLTAGAATLPVTPAWSRAAHATARHLEQRRRFKPHGPRRVDATSSAFAAKLNRLPFVARLCSGDLALYSVPLIDGTGDVVEHRLIAIDLNRAGGDRGWLRAAPESLVRFLAASSSARQRRLERWLQCRADRLTATERALQHANVTVRRASQAGLFDRRELTVAERRREEALELDLIADARVEEYRVASIVAAGAPVLEVLLEKNS